MFAPLTTPKPPHALKARKEISYPSYLPFLMSMLLFPVMAQERLPSAPWTPRKGLPNVAAKLEAGRPVTLAFVGGSITAGGGEHGYVAATTRWLREQWPNAEIQVVNAGISGTGSDFGARRFDRDVLVHKPDLILIEFAVNDGPSDHSAFMERMVHKTWMEDAETDLVFFYTLSRGHLDDYAAGRLPISAHHHERVAVHYGIPTIGLAHVVAEQLRNGDLEWSGFANDAVHPHTGGYALFNAVFRDALPVLLRTGTAAPHTLNEPLNPTLRVYEPEIVAHPLPEIPFVLEDGTEAKRSFSLPVPGVHWVGEPVYRNDEGRALWRLHWISKASTTAMDETIGIEKAAWAEHPMQWFEEDTSFTGQEGMRLFHPNAGRTSVLGFSGRECAVLVFVAPETGSYQVRFGADSLSAWRNEQTPFALHVAQFAWGDPRGTSLALVREIRSEIQPFTRELSVRLVAGEELIFLPGTGTPAHIRGGWTPFQVHIGWFGDEDPANGKPSRAFDIR